MGPTLSIRGAGARASVDLDYSFRQIYFAERDTDERIHDLVGRGQVEFWRQVGFLDATASMTRATIDNTGAISRSTAGEVANRTDQRAVGLSPFLLSHFGPWADSEVRLSYDHVSYETLTIPDTNEFGADINLTNGRRFGRLGWGVRLHGDRLEREAVLGNTANDVNTLQADVDGTFALTRQISVIGSVGYERIEDQTLVDEPNGLTWSAGLGLRPSGRTNLRATYGRRYDDTNVSLDATHQLTSRTVIQASISESLQTNQRLAGQDLSFLGVDAAGNLIDSRTGLPFTTTNDAFGLQARTFRQRVGSVGLTTRRARDTVSLRASLESREVETPASREDVVVGAGLSASRQLSRRTLGNVAVDFSHIDLGDGSGREDDLLTVSANLTYEIFRDTRAVIAFTRTQRTSNRDGGDLTENAAFIRLSKGF